MWWEAHRGLRKGVVEVFSADASLFIKETNNNSKV